MSATITTTPTPTTDRALAAATTLATLAATAEENPVVKADLQKQFDSYSHSPLIMAVASVAGMMLTRQNITVDNTLLTVLVGAAVTAIGYAWQWASIKFNKPVATVTAP